MATAMNNRPLTLARRSFIAGTAAMLALMDGCSSASPPQQDESLRRGRGDQVQEILAAHNKYRAAVGVPALRWSDSLAAGAQQWADYLATTGWQLQHSDRGGRSGIGENLIAGRSSFKTDTQLVDIWGDEKRYFIGGIFPNVSSNGNWEDVGHYTQVVWRNTTQVGCGVTRANGHIAMVCRYSPGGNVLGESVY